MRFKDVINPQRIKMFLRNLWWKNREEGINLKPEDALAFSEMVVYRSRLCPQCTTAGKCIGTEQMKEDGIEACKCPTPDLYAAWDANCSGGLWTGFKGNWVEEWNKYKKERNIQLNIFY